jgi:hypothetical protein
MTNNPNFLHHDYLPYLDPYEIAIFDWCVLDGGEVITEVLSVGTPLAIFVKGCELYVGPPTCADETSVYKDERYFFPHHVVEIASLLDMGSPLPAALLKQLVRPIQQRLAATHDGHSIEVEVAEMDTDRCIWVVRRFTPDELESAEFDAMMREHLALTHEVEAALSSH